MTFEFKENHFDFSAKEHLETERSRRFLYRFLSMFFLYPTKERFHLLANGSFELQNMLENMEGCFAGTPSLNDLLLKIEQFDEKDLVKLEEEFVYLFQAKAAAPPYESYYMDKDGFNRNKIFSQIEHEYASAGLCTNGELNEWPDHMAIELEYMSFLCTKYIQCVENDDIDQAVSIKLKEEKFYFLHLGAWYNMLCEKIIEAQPQEMFNHIIPVLKEFLISEKNYLISKRFDNK